MTVTQHDTRDEDHASLQTSPGHRLREARLSAKISLEEMAAHLHLDPRLVDALENDRYPDLPEPTFVRGYLRGYARVLGLPPAPIIEAYDRHGFGAPKLIPDIASRPQAQSSDTSVRLVTFIVTAVLIALMLLWWQTQQSVLTVPPDNTTTSAAEAPDELPGEEPVPEIAAAPEPAAEQATTQTPEASGIEGAVPRVAFAEPAEPDPAATVPAPMAPPEPFTAEESVLSERASEEATGAAPAQPPPEPAVREPAGDQMLPADRLDIRFSHDSWVEIYDRDETKLFFGLAKAGQGVSVAGGPPLRVLLGYARDVQIQYNGQFFDPAPYMRGDVARFTVGAASAR